MTIPIVTYGSAVYVANIQEDCRAQAAEMRFLRWVEGCTKLDGIRNEEIRRKLQLVLVEDTIVKYKKAWSWHLLSMRHSLPFTACMEISVTG